MIARARGVEDNAGDDGREACELAGRQELGMRSRGSCPTDARFEDVGASVDIVLHHTPGDRAPDSSFLIPDSTRDASTSARRASVPSQKFAAYGRDMISSGKESRRTAYPQ